MDLNQLLHAHQVAVMQASAAGDAATRDNHFAKVVEYAERIALLRAQRQRSSDDRPLNGGATIIYGSYAGDRPTVSSGTVESWEDEGGAVDTQVVPSPEELLPEGVTTTNVRLYHVAGHVYEDLDLAMAEHMRQMSR